MLAKYLHLLSAHVFTVRPEKLDSMDWISLLALGRNYQTFSRLLLFNSQKQYALSLDAVKTKINNTMGRNRQARTRHSEIPSRPEHT